MKNKNAFTLAASKSGLLTRQNGLLCFYRNNKVNYDKIACHPELRKANKRETSFVSLRPSTESLGVSGSSQQMGIDKILKKVQFPEKRCLMLQNDSNMLLKKKVAFTLAEVLITLSILGIVAAIAIPNIIHNFQNTVSLTKLKKTYAKITNSFDEAMVINNCDSMGCVLQKNNITYSATSTNTDQYDIQLEALKVFLPDIKQDKKFNCVPKDVYDLNGNKHHGAYEQEGLYGISKGHYYTYCLKDNVGLLVGVQELSTRKGTNCMGKGGTACFSSYIYTGANKNKATIGRNLFFLYLFGNNEVLLNLAAKCNPDEYVSPDSGYPNGAACLQRLMKNNWKIDY